MNREHAEQMMAEALARRQRNIATRKRRIEMGYDPHSKILPNGAILTQKPKGYTRYPTATLVKMIEATMDRFELTDNKRRCPINGKWQLQVRGADLRRVLKKRPTWKQEGRYIVDKEGP